MNIKQLKLQNVGRFSHETEINFNRGFNLIFGENEAGKSTIVKAIETSFFGFKPAKDWKYANWDNHDALIECHLDHKDHELEIVRKYGSKIRGTTRSGHVADNIGNQPIEGHLVDLELYKALFSITVDELTGIDKKSWKELSASLTDAYNHSAFKSASEARENLDSKASEIYKENGRGQFLLKNLQQSQSELEEKRSQLLIEKAYAERSAEEILNIKNEIERLSEGIKNLDYKIEHFEENHQRLGKIRSYRRKLKDYAAIEALNLPPRVVIERWQISEDKYQVVDRELTRLEEEQSRLVESLEAAKLEYVQGKKRFPKLRFGLGILSIICGAVYLVFALKGGLYQMEQAISAVLFIFGIALLSNVGFVSSKNKKSKLRAYDARVTEISQRRQYLQMQQQHFEDDLKMIEEDVANLREKLEQTGFDDIDALRQWAAKGEQLQSELSTLLDSEQDVQGFLSIVNEENGSLSAEELGLKELLDQRDTLSEAKLKQEALVLHQTNLSVSEINYQINAIEEQLHLNFDSIMEQSFERDRLMFISRIVSEAERLYRKSQKPDFLIRASRYMQLLSHSKYEEILMTESGGFVLKSGSELVPMSETVSRGTKEQMYLALKLAMTFRLDPLGQYPILMDEIAVNFDKRRQEGLFKVIEELSSQRQVMYFTCHDWFVEAANKVLEGHLITLNNIKNTNDIAIKQTEREAIEVM